MIKDSFRENWANKDTKWLTEKFINHIEDKYYLDYLNESRKYESINNFLFMTITIIGFLVTILIGLQVILKDQIPNYLEIIFTILTFILPPVSSVMLVYVRQIGLKKKEEIREEARIKCKYLINEARIRFSKINNNPDDYERLYNWLNKEVEQLQLSQARSYFSVHNIQEVVDKKEK